MATELRPFLTEIADAIREKKGSSDPINAQNFASEISTIETGDIIIQAGIPTIDNIRFYRFMDYDGTLLYAYTDEELDALTELPAGPDHTDENLTFQEWNWTLEDLKAWDRNRPDRPLVGANLITTDGKTYIDIDIPYDNFTFSFAYSFDVDWGDGSSSNEKTHVYATAGKYTIISNDIWSAPSIGNLASSSCVIGLKLGDIQLTNPWRGCYEKVNIPNTITTWQAMGSADIRAIVVPKTVTAIPRLGMRDCYRLEYVSLPNTIITYGSTSTSAYTTNAPLEGSAVRYLTIPSSITTLGTGCFQEMRSLEEVYIPDTVTSLVNLSRFFLKNYSLKSIRFPNTVSLQATTASSMFTDDEAISNLELPEGLTSIKQQSFFNCKALRRIVFPSTLTNLDAYLFNQEVLMLTLDLTKIQSVVSLDGYIGSSSDPISDGWRILVPSTLVESYKTATNWSTWADIIYGV